MLKNFASISKNLFRVAVAALTLIAVTATLSGSARAVMDISAGLSDSPDPVVRGQNITYGVVVHMAGNQVDAGNSWSIPLPPNLTFVSLTATNHYADLWSCSTPAAGVSGTVSCSTPYATAALGVSATWSLVVNSTSDAAPTRSATLTVSSNDPDPNGSNNSATATTGVGIPSSTSVASISNPSTYGHAIGFTATVSPGGGGTPTGTVTFTIDGVAQAPVALSGAEATFTTSALGVGSHSVIAAYSGDSNFAPSTSSTLTQVVNKANSTTTLVSSANPSTHNQSVTLTATVTNGATGTVTFTIDGAAQAPVGLSGSTATLSTSSLATGSHSITATYNGDGNYNASTSSTLTQTVEQATTTVALTSSSNPSTSWQNVTLTATVSAQTGTPTGTVTFKDGSATLATETLAGGQATFAIDTLKPGRHRIVATYNGNATFSAANSPMLRQDVNPHVGVEFRVNTTTAGSQQQPAIARLAGDGFAVVWTSSAADGAADIFAQRYRNNGTKAGREFGVNGAGMKEQTRPAVTGLADGGFVAVWQTDATSAPRTGARRGGGSGGGAVIGQRFNKNGAKAGGEFEVGPAAAGQLAEPTVAGLANGGFAVVWNLGEGPGIVGRIFNAAGAKQGQDIRVTPANVKDPAQPAIAALSGGGFVVAWQEGAASSRAIAGQRVKASGVNDGAVIRFGTGARSAPALAGLADGGFAAAWQAEPGDGSGLGIFAERYGSNGARQGAAFRVNTMRTNDQWEPVVSGFANGGFIVAWTSRGQDGSGNGVYAQGYMSSATPVFSEFRANTTVTQNQWQPAVAAFSSGQLVTAWTSRNQDGALEGVYGQRFDLMGLTGE